MRAKPLDKVLRALEICEKGEDCVKCPYYCYSACSYYLRQDEKFYLKEMNEFYEKTTCEEE